jgi:hypothetical protein
MIIIIILRISIKKNRITVISQTVLGNTKALWGMGGGIPLRFELGTS